MPTSDAWDDIVSRLRSEPDPARSRFLVDLYRLAEEQAPRILTSFRRRIDEERMRDLVRDLLSLKLDAILEADAPWALFKTALRRRAISWIRRRDADVAEPPDSHREAISAQGDDEEDRRAGRIDAERVMIELSQRDRDVVLAVARGEEREVIARELKTTRANIDQIVSRTHRKLRGDDK